MVKEEVWNGQECLRATDFSYLYSRTQLCPFSLSCADGVLIQVPPTNLARLGGGMRGKPFPGAPNLVNSAARAGPGGGDMPT